MAKQHLYIFINLYMLQATMCPSSGEKTVVLLHLHSILHTRHSSTENNKQQVSQKHSCFSWWWAHSRPNKNKFMPQVGFI